MKLKPASTKASSTAKEAFSSALQPKTLPPSPSGATMRSDRPIDRFSINALHKSKMKPGARPRPAGVSCWSKYQGFSSDRIAQCLLAHAGLAHLLDRRVVEKVGRDVAHL